MIPFLLVPLAGALFVAGLLAAEARGSRRGRILFKVLASLSFLLYALLQGPEGRYGLLLFAGLVLGAVGDVALLAPGKRGFLVGLAAFLLGHLAYLGAFWILLAGWPPFFFLLPLTGAALLVLAWLLPHLEEGMAGPVVLYLVAISAMVWAAWGIAADGDLPEHLRLLVGVGATAFYVSDLAVARERFVRSSLTNKLWGLPLYYLGQFLLAATLGYRIWWRG